MQKKMNECRMTPELFDEIMRSDLDIGEKCEELWNKGMCNLGIPVRKCFNIDEEREYGLEYLAIHSVLERFCLLGETANEPIKTKKANLGAFVIKAKWAILHAYRDDKDEAEKLSVNYSKFPNMYGDWTH